MTVPTVLLPSHPLPELVADRLSRGTDTTDLSAALEQLLSDGRALRAWLTSIVHDSAVRAPVTEASYWHVNGFAKLILHSTDVFRIRLHVWPRVPGRRGETDPHSHRWAFASTVLTGAGLSITEHVEVEAGFPFIRYCYDGRRLVPSGRALLDSGTTRTVHTRERYTTDTDIVHTVTPLGDDLIATLVVQGPHVQDTTVVYGPLTGELMDAPGKAIDDMDVQRLVAAVLATLDPGSDGPEVSTPLPDAEPRLGDLGEHRIYAELLEPRYRAVPSFGDDCATFADDRVITTDTCSTALVASLGVNDPVYTGWLLAAMNLSDLAAAGAEPDGLVVNYTLPRDTPVATLDRIMEGVDACCRAHGTRVIGGDIGEGGEVRLSATAVGHCPKRPTPDGPVRTRLGRRGAQPGDHLLLIGSPGYLWGAALLHHNYAQVPDEEREEVFARACAPMAQVAAGRALAGAGLARAGTDVSDGLYASVRNLCQVNELGARLSADLRLDDVLMRICTQAGVDPFELGQMWGDWCLLVAVHEADLAAAMQLVTGVGVAVRDVGVFTPAAGELQIHDGTGVYSQWHGVDQERFAGTSWRGGVVGELERMRRRSALPHSRRP